MLPDATRNNALTSITTKLKKKQKKTARQVNLYSEL